MQSRRKFIEASAITSAAILATPLLNIGCSPEKLVENQNKKSTTKGSIPIVISTWKFGVPANDVAWKILNNGGKAIDAVEQGVRVPEADPSVTSVGYGGYPDRDGYVTLDACIMDENGNCGSVSFLQTIKHPISVARMVMDKTPHVMLSGGGALKFALDNGFIQENLLTENAKQYWEDRLKEANYKPANFNEMHDTIGMLAIDKNNNIAGACTTSGLAMKYHGRVGDSPIIGAGLFVDNEVGGATATGKGEAVIKVAGAAIIVEMMRNGKSPQEACELAIERIISKQKDYKEFQVGFLALNKKGEYGAFSIQKGFEYALCYNSENKLMKAEHSLQ